MTAAARARFGAAAARGRMRNPMQQRAPLRDCARARLLRRARRTAAWLHGSCMRVLAPSLPHSSCLARAVGRTAGARGGGRAAAGGS